MTDEQRQELEVLARLVRERKIDRRSLIQATAAIGLTGTAARRRDDARFLGRRAGQSDKLLATVSTEQQPTWIRNFNPLPPEHFALADASGIYEPLVVFNGHERARPWLATEWEFNADNTKLTFTIRDGVKWSDGSPSPPRTSQFTFDYMAQHEALAGTEAFGSVAVFLGESRRRTTRPSRQLHQVFTPGLYDVAEQNIVPEHIWKDIADPVKYPNENPVGTGPFTEIGLRGPDTTKCEEPELLAARQALHRRVPLPGLPGQRRRPTWRRSTARTTSPPTSSPTSRRPTSPRTRRTSTTGSPRSARPSSSISTPPARRSTIRRPQGDQHGHRPRRRSSRSRCTTTPSRPTRPA